MQLQLLAHYVNASNAANQQGQHAKALEFSQLALALNPVMPEAWFNQGVAQARLGQRQAATASLEQARRCCLDSAEGQNSIGLELLELGMLDAAELSLRQAIQLMPQYAHAHSNLGKLYRHRKLPNEALQHVLRAIELTPQDPLLLVNLASIHLDLKQFVQAEQACRRAINLHSGQAQARVNLSAALHKQGRLAEAEAEITQALKLTNKLPEAWEVLGDVLVKRNRLQDAETAFKTSISLKPASAQAWTSLGQLYRLQNRHELAEFACRKSTEIDPAIAVGWNQLGLTLRELKRPEEAIICLKKAYSLDPKIDGLLSWKLLSEAAICDWSDRASSVNDLITLVRHGDVLSVPLALLALVDDPQLQRIATESYTKQVHPATFSAPKTAALSDGRIRIGYFSADFNDHPVSQQLVELLEMHDRSRFEVHGFSFGPKSASPLGQRVSETFDHFHDVQGRSDTEIIQLAHGQKLAIAVNLSGYTAGHRTNVFAARIAPAQVSYLGFPGTMGADYMDYLVADAVVCPPGSEAWYTEKLARLTNCFMPHDGKQAIASLTLSRSEFGLPETGFVFCCFNNPHKISPAIFEIWMRLLAQVEGSTLWLSDGPDLMKVNLGREASARGIDPKRLVFARRVDQMDDHLARYRLADLFIDTLPYNAHTTACDALWAGVPVLTCSGKSFAGRVAASLLHTLGLPELVTDNAPAYEAMALALAQDPTRLNALRQTLKEKRLNSPPFNTPQLTRELEALFEIMHKRSVEGLPPDHLDLLRE